MGWHGDYVATFEITQSDPPVGGSRAVVAALKALLDDRVVGKPLGKTKKSVKKVTVSFNKIPD